jgi:sarcosine oxidase subunit alpha
MSERKGGQIVASRIEEHAVLGPLPSKPQVAFRFDGAEIAGRAGEPIAAALLAAGVRSFRTMPRFGDRRGGYCMVGRCADCLVEVDGELNVRACLRPVSAGIEVRSH